MGRGIFVSIEGIDGSGKTTLKQELIDHFSGQTEVLGIREPGGTDVSEKIRKILLDEENRSMLPRTEALLYAAARSQVVEELIRPALEAGKMVIADRYMDSTIAYQGYGRGLDFTFLSSLNQLCTGGLTPDLTLLLDLDTYIARSRLLHRRRDRLEGEGFVFQQRVRRGYLDLFAGQPDRIRLLEASQSKEALLRQAVAMISDLMEEAGGPR